MYSKIEPRDDLLNLGEKSRFLIQIFLTHKNTFLTCISMVYVLNLRIPIKRDYKVYISRIWIFFGVHTRVPTYFSVRVLIPLYRKEAEGEREVSRGVRWTRACGTASATLYRPSQNFLNLTWERTPGGVTGWPNSREPPPRSHLQHYARISSTKPVDLLFLFILMALWHASRRTRWIPPNYSILNPSISNIEPALPFPGSSRFAPNSSSRTTAASSLLVVFN